MHLTIVGVVYFNHKDGCIKCTIKGKWCSKSHCTVFADTSCPRRTDADFRRRVYKDHHVFKSPIEHLPIDMVQDIITSDLLHLIYLGIQKTLLKGWYHGSFIKKTGKWTSDDIIAIDGYLLECKLPKEIHRAVRSLDCLHFWKGLEFRTFFHYISIAVLKNVLPREVYEHFLLLYCGITICCSDIYKENIHVANDMLNEFIERHIDIYHFGHVTMNIHNLTHVVEDVTRFGNLTKLTTFPFENALYHMKFMIKKGQHQLQQIAKRTIEINNVKSFKNITPTTTYPILKHKKDSLYKTVLINEELMFSTNFNDKWFLTKSKQIVEIHGIFQIDGHVQIVGHILKKKWNYFELPLLSSQLNIFVSNIGDKTEAFLFGFESIKCKLVIMNLQNDEHLFIPLLHTLDLCEKSNYNV